GIKAVEIERGAIDVKGIAPRQSHDRLVRPEGAAKLRDVDLERLGCGRRRLIPPQLVDQPLHGDDVWSLEEEDRQQRSLLGRGQSHRSPRILHKQRTEYAELHTPAARYRA